MTSEQEAVFRSLQPVDLLSVAIYGEARGEPIEAKIAHAWVIRNRVLDARWPDNYPDVILQRKQLSAFNDDDANLPIMYNVALNIAGGKWPDNPYLTECWYSAYGVIMNWVRDNTKGANHYNTIDCNPRWDDTMCLTARYGKTEFFKG
jgi:spore germination cell wall hydrolase CwlJ-like protein